MNSPSAGDTVGFGCPKTVDPHHFIVEIPLSRSGGVMIVEHYGIRAGINGLPEVAERCHLPRPIWSLIAGLQGDQAPLLITQAGNPLQSKITSDGKLMGGATPALPAGAQPMDPEQARKMLERFGIDLDEIMKHSEQTGGGDPPEDK